MRMRRALQKRERKVATNLSIRADVAQEAKSLGLNLSEVFEDALREAIRRRRAEIWRDENRRAIDSYNAAVAKDGLFSDGWRKF
jgi:antitoxin CcdA